VFQNIFIDKEKNVHLWDDELGYTQFPYKDFNYAYRPDPNGQYISLHGQRVKKINRWGVNDLSVIEADLPRETRVLTDLYKDSDEPAKSNVLAIVDIEVETKLGLPNVLKPMQQILSISVEDTSTGEEYVFILDEDEILADYENEVNPNLVVISCISEAELLDCFLNTWEEINPTIVTGWNSDYFDIPYLYRRTAMVLGEDEANRLSPIRVVEFNKTRGKYRIAGVSCLDYLDLYKKFTYTELPNYRLDTVARKELNEGKKPYEGTLDELFETDLKTFLEYNIRDVRLVSGLDKKKKLIRLVVGICTLGHVPYEEYSYSSRWLEGALITDLHRQGIVAPNKPVDGREQMQALKSGTKGFTGAYVKFPQLGRHEWVYSLDLQSLYPSIIMSLNISPETKIGKVVDWNIDEFVRKEREHYVVKDLSGREMPFNREDFVKFMKDSKFTVSSNGVLYRTDVDGLIPKTLEKWFAERVEYRKKMKEAAHAKNEEEREYYDMRQHIQKIFLNSLYGVLGLPVFRFYDVDNALAVTASGQDVIKTSARVVNQHYNKELETDGEDFCIYIDTDSLYFSVCSLGSASRDNFLELAIKTARQMEEKLNKFYDVLAKNMFFTKKHRFVIRGETIAEAGFWVNKKRYALKKVYDLENNLLLEEPKITVKGLDVVRSSFPRAFQKFMKEVLKDILNDKPKEELDAKILNFRHGLPKMDIRDIARNTAVKNVDKYSLPNQIFNQWALGTPAHVKAAITHNLLLRYYDLDLKYRSITNGAKIKWVYLRDNPLKLESLAFFGDEEDCPKIAKYAKEYIDYDRIFEVEFSHKLQDFYEALDWGNIPTDVNQKAFDFFDM